MATSHILSRPFSKDRIAIFREGFTEMETYDMSSGTIHQTELVGFNNSCGVPTSEAQARVYNRYWAHLRGDDRVPVNELMKIFEHLHDPVNLALVVFKLFDKQGDGTISQEEFDRGMKFLVAYNPHTFGTRGNCRLDSFITAAGSERVDLEEFENWIRKL